MTQSSDKVIETRVFKPGVYRHFKGGMYLALFIAKDTEELKDFVVYIALYTKEDQPSKTWVRQLDDFMGKKVLEDGTEVNRYEFVSEK